MNLNLCRFILMQQIVLFILLAIVTLQQSCIDSSGQPIAWWVVMKVPPKTGQSGYGYYDSNMRDGEFVYVNQPIDKGNTPLTLTFQTINNMHLQHIAWNDQKPTGEVNATSAHSKGIIAYSLTPAKGLFLTHSIPKYPSFQSTTVIPDIADSQNYYGQNLACFSLTLKELDDIASYLLITMPFIYGGTATDTTSTHNLYKLSQSIFSQSGILFNQHEFRSALGYNLKTIYKNNKVNGSIFEDGLTNYLVVSPIIAQTWGRPIQDAWCSERFQVYNVISLNLSGVTWNQQDDHSKWAIANNEYACFGDMNRMTSQWKRGGSFFCLSDSTLVKAIKKIIVSHDQC